jgi:hypothetical protein
MNKFETGKLYAQEYACGDGRYQMECVKRSEKSVTFKDIGGKISRFKIRKESNGNEVVYNSGWIASEPTLHFMLCTL